MLKNGFGRDPICTLFIGTIEHAFRIQVNDTRILLLYVVYLFLCRHIQMY